MTKLVVLWFLWCFLHSLLTTSSMHRWVERRGKAWQAWYRLTYVAFSCISLLPLLWYSMELPQHHFSLPWDSARIIQSGLLGYSAFMFLGGCQAYDMLAFIGIRQLQQYRIHQPAQTPIFHTTGILKYVRHPWYTAGLGFLWGLPGFTDFNLCLRILLTAYLCLGTLLEERKLKEQFGQQYSEYCHRVPMLIPWQFWRNIGNKKGKTPRDLA